MSYILEALKKSEQEREQGSVPDLQSIHRPATQEGNRFPVWLIIIVVSIVLAAGITTILRTTMPWETLWRDTPTRENAVLKEEGAPGSASSPVNSAPPVVTASAEKKSNQQTPLLTQVDTQNASTTPSQASAQSNQQAAMQTNKQATKTQESSPAAAMSDSKSKSSANVVFLEQEIPDDQMYSSAPLKLQESETAPDDSSVTKQHAAGDKEVTSTNTSQSRIPGADIPNIANLPVSFRTGIPDLTFSGHVYNSVPERRSVIINDKFMREGEFVTRDIKLVEITDRGAVFLYKDTLFRLGALQDWISR